MLSPEFFANEYEAYEDFSEPWTLRPLPVVDWDEDRDGSPITREPIPVNSPSRAAVAHVFAGYFHREAGFDFRPYSAGDEADGGRDVYLIPTRQMFTGAFPIATGAVGVITMSGVSVVTWAWLHPIERAKSPDRWTTAFNWLEERYPGLGLEGPLRPAMKTWALNRWGSLEGHVYRRE